MKINLLLPIALLAWQTLSVGTVYGQPPERQNEGTTILKEADAISPSPNVSPVRRIVRTQNKTNDTRPPRPTAFRSINGWHNNPNDPGMGSSHSQLFRVCPSEYSDGFVAMSGADRPSARLISNVVCAQTTSKPNTFNASDFLWQWGQFLDHDIDLTDGTDPPEPANIAVPQGDPFFDPKGTGNKEIEFNRSIWDSETGTDPTNPRQQINEITHWIDASNVYGSTEERAQALRTMDGTGKLKTSAGNLLPFNVDGLPNAGGDSASLFLAGDVRANEQVGLLAMHTLFVREHNYWCDIIQSNNPKISGEEIYQRARNVVAAEMQVITYFEYLPLLLGKNWLRPYAGYQANINASIATEFSTASYRYGHSALSPQLLRLDASMQEIEEGHLPLRDAFFSPSRLVEEGGIEPVLRGLATQTCQEIDAYVIDDVRNFLFGPPGSGGFDLASLNIQRGRDHGLPTYNQVRIAFGLAPKKSFEAINPDPAVHNRLRTAYGDVDLIDAWVGGLAEARHADAMVGELVFTVLRDQFEALRDGDRFWFEESLAPQMVRRIRNTKLSDIIRRNTSIGNEIADDVFQTRASKSETAQTIRNLK